MFFFLAGLVWISPFGFAAPSRQVQESEPSTAEALEMIALRLESLSASLREMPEAPSMNQTIQLPLPGEIRLPHSSAEQPSEKDLNK